MKTLVTTFI